MAQLAGPSFGPSAGGPPRQLVVLLHGVGADGQDLIEPGADAGARAAARAVRRARRARALRHGALWPPVVQPPGPPAGGHAGRRRRARRRCSTRSRRAAGAARPGRPPPGPGRLLAGHDDGAASSGRAGRGRWRRSWASPVRCSAAQELPREARSRPPVMLIHGDADDVVPVAGAVRWPSAGLQAAEIPVQWIVRPGLPHSIDPEGSTAGGRFLREMLAGSASTAVRGLKSHERVQEPAGERVGAIACEPPRQRRVLPPVPPKIRTGAAMRDPPSTRCDGPT